MPSSQETGVYGARVVPKIGRSTHRAQALHTRRRTGNRRHRSRHERERRCRSLITSAQIKDGTIQNKDIKKGTIALDRLTPATQKAIKRAATPGATGATGAAGANGATGADGRPGTTVQASPGLVPTSGNWGVINRNTEGSPAAYLRSGPLTPPVGKGSLNLTVKDGTEKVAFGNEVDTLAGGEFAKINRVGFNVYTTGENNAKGRRPTCRASRSRSTRTSTA